MTLATAQVELPALSLTLLGLLLLGVVGGQFPDIDQPTSTIANSGRAVGRMMRQHGLLGFLVKVLFWIINFIPQTMAWIANNFFGGHRGVVHSLLAMLVARALVEEGIAAWPAPGLIAPKGYAAIALATAPWFGELPEDVSLTIQAIAKVDHFLFAPATNLPLTQHPHRHEHAHPILHCQ